RTGKLCLHRDRRKVDLRQRRNGQFQKGEHPRKRNPQGEQRGCYRPGNKRGGDVHGEALPARAAIFTSRKEKTPSVRRDALSQRGHLGDSARRNFSLSLYIRYKGRVRAV